MSRQKQLKPVPSFQTLQEEAEFWDSHDSTEYELEETDEVVKLSEAQKAHIKARWEQRKRATIRLSSQQLEAIERIAQRKQVDYRTLIHEWINQSIERTREM